MENQELLKAILNKLEGIENKLDGLENGQQDIKIKMNQMDEKIELLTSQTSNAIIEHHSGSINFLKTKVMEMEEEIFKLKRS